MTAERMRRGFVLATAALFFVAVVGLLVSDRVPVSYWIGYLFVSWAVLGSIVVVGWRARGRRDGIADGLVRSAPGMVSKLDAVTASMVFGGPVVYLLFPRLAGVTPVASLALLVAVASLPGVCLWLASAAVAGRPGDVDSLQEESRTPGVIVALLAAAILPALTLSELVRPRVGVRGEVFVVALVAAVLAMGGLRVTIVSREARRLADRLRRLAMYDPLTEALSRGALFEVASTALSSGRRGHEPVSLVYMDLDGLKARNDRYGHDAGDLHLATFVDRLRGIVRAGDTIARLGGDEFVLLCPATDSSGAAALVHRLRRATDGLPPHAFSAGVVTAHPGSGTTVDDLLRRGDRLMYQAKRAGGNRTEIQHAQAADGTAPVGAVAEPGLVAAWPAWARPAAFAYVAAAVLLSGIIGSMVGGTTQYWVLLLATGTVIALPAVVLTYKLLSRFTGDMHQIWRDWFVGVCLFTLGAILEIVGILTGSVVIVVLLVVVAVGVGRYWGAVALGRLIRVAGARSILVDSLDATAAAIVVSAPLVYGLLPTLASSGGAGMVVGFGLVLTLVPALAWLAWINYEVSRDASASDVPVGLFLAFALVSWVNLALQMAQGVSDLAIPGGPLYVLHALNMSILLLVPLYSDPAVRPPVAPAQPASRRGTALPYLASLVLPVLLVVSVADAGAEPWRPLYVSGLLGVMLVLGAARSRLAGAEANRLSRRLERQARRDPLTGALNRRALFDAASSELARGRRRGSGTTLVLIDLDGLKVVNDQAGHDMGDLYLQSFVGTAMQVLRDGDSLARLGGDEFVLLLPMTSEEGGIAFVGRLRSRLAVLDVAGHPVHFSAGVREVLPSERSAFPELVKQADALMYEAKRAGGDMAIAASGSA